MNQAATARAASVQAGVAAGLVGLATFLVVHHLLIVPIWFVAPVGAILAAAGGAAVGAAYAELRPHLPPRPWTAFGVAGLIAVVLLPALVVAELRGPIYDLDGTLLVPPTEAILDVVVGLLGSATVVGAAVGLLVGRSRRAAGMMAVAGLALAIGPGHNIPMLAATPAVRTELIILGVVMAVASIALVEVQSRLVRRALGLPMLER